MRRPPGLSPADLGSLFLILLVVLYVGRVNGHYSYDDAFITYRMAEHFARGIGFVYNPGDWHLGSTAALYGLILGVFGRLFEPDAIPAIAGVVASVSLLVTGWSLYGMGRLAGAPLCGLAAGLFYVTNPMIFVTFGGEMPFVLALVAAAFCAYGFGWRATATVLATLAIVARPDGVIAAGLLLAWDAVARRRLPWRELVIGAALLAPWIALGWWAYGTPLPSTLAAKLAQRDSGLWGTFGSGLVWWVRLFLWDDTGPNNGFVPVKPPTLWLWTIVGAIALFRPSYRGFRPLVLWCAAFTLAYTLLGVPFYHWYAAPAALGMSVLAACGLCSIVSLARAAWPRIDARLAAAVAVAATLAIAARPLVELPRSSTINATARLYTQVGRWLAANTRATSRVGYYEIGYIGYYGHRPMIDSLGLIDPAVSPYVARRDFASAFEHARPDYILEKRGVGHLNAFLDRPWFTQEYGQRATLTLTPDAPEAVIVHERIKK